MTTALARARWHSRRRAGGRFQSRSAGSVARTGARPRPAATARSRRGLVSHEQSHAPGDDAIVERRRVGDAPNERWCSRPNRSPRVGRLAAAPDLRRGARWPRRRALRLTELGVSRALVEHVSRGEMTSRASRCSAARRALVEIRASPAIEAARPRAVRVSREAIAPRGRATHSSRWTPASSSVTLSKASAGVSARRPVSIGGSGCRPDRGSILGSPTPRPAEAHGSGPPGRRYRNP